MNIQVVTYDPKWRDQILGLMDEVPYKKLIWEWQFERPGIVAACPGIVALEGERVVGFNGVMPVTVCSQGVERPAAWSCDFYIHPDYRGQGIGKRIKAALIEQGPDLIMSLGVSSQAAAVLSRMGWKQSDQVTNYRRFKGRSHRARGLALLQLLNRLSGGWYRPWKGQIEWLAQLPGKSELNQLWFEMAEVPMMLVKRDWDYMHWKYEQHPNAGYQFLAATDRNGNLSGLLVIRQSKGIVRIVDWLGPLSDERLFRSLFDRVICRYSGARLVTVRTSGKVMMSALKNSGFHRSRAKTGFFVKDRRKTAGAEDNHWFLMSGDSDGEILMATADSVSGGFNE